MKRKNGSAEQGRKKAGKRRISSAERNRNERRNSRLLAKSGISRRNMDKMGRNGVFGRLPKGFLKKIPLVDDPIS